MSRRRSATAATIAALVIGLSSLTWTSSTWAIDPGAGCASCHVPHNAHPDPAVPLWNPEAAGGSFESPPDVGSLGEVRGASILCLSCHDGSGASASHSFGAGPEAGMGSLTATHPIGVVYAEAHSSGDTQFRSPATLAQGVLDGEGMVGCQSCHVVHGEGYEGKRLRWPYLSDPGASTDFCRNCHVK